MSETCSRPFYDGSRSVHPHAIDATSFILAQVMNDVVCASSVEQLEAKIPKYFDRDYVQHVDGKTIGYDEFVEHMKVLHGKIKDVSVRWKGYCTPTHSPTTASARRTSSATTS